MKFEKEVIDLLEEVFSVGKYSGKLFIASPQNINYIEKRIHLLKKIIPVKNTVYYFHCRELLNYIKDIIDIFLRNPGYYLASTVESFITVKIFIRKEKISREEAASIKELLEFIRNHIKANEVYLEGLLEEIKILKKILKKAYLIKHDKVLIEIMRRLNNIKEEANEFKTDNKTNPAYEDILQKVYGISLREIEDYIITKAIEYEHTIRNTYIEDSTPELSINQIIAALKTLAEDVFKLSCREKLYVRKMPLLFAKYYGEAIYIPSEKIYEKSIPGFLWINIKAAKKLPKGELIMLLAHETYFGHHYYYTSLAKRKIPKLMKIPIYTKATPLAEGIAVYGEYIIGENLGYEAELKKRLLVKFIRALNDIAVNKYTKTPAILKRYEKIVEKYSTFSKIRPGYWLCYIAGFKYIKELEKYLESPKQLYDYIIDKGLISLSLLKGIEYACT